MKQIKLTQGQYALVDDADYDWLSQWKWCAQKIRGNFYAVRRSLRTNKNRKQYSIYMHRQILGLKRKDKRQGDHIDHNTLDNQRENLRVCTGQQNHRNRKSHLNSSSNFKGIFWVKGMKKWRSSIGINGKSKHLGYWNIEEVAALAYDMVAIREFGDFAILNFN